MKSAALTDLRDFSEKLSPMVVKELRQGLRSRYFIVLLLLFHLTFGLYLAVALGSPPNRFSDKEAMWTMMAFTLLALLPGQAWKCIHDEAKDGTLEMLRITSTTGFQMVWGKWCCYAAQTLLLVCSVLPYLVARYFLGGVELLPEFFALSLLVVCSFVLTAGVVAFSTQPKLWVRLSSAVVFSLLALCAGVVATELATSEFFTRDFLRLAPSEHVLMVLYGVTLGVLSVWLFVHLGASRLATVSEEYSARKRLFMLALLAVTTLVGICCAHIYSGTFGFFVLVPMLWLVLWFGTDVCNEELPLYPSVVAQVQKRYPRLKAFHFLLYPGWASGVYCYSVALLFPLALAIVIAVEERFVTHSFVAGLGCLLAGVYVPVCLHSAERTETRFERWWIIQSMLFLAMFVLAIGGIFSGGALTALGLLTPVSSLMTCSFLADKAGSEHIFWAGFTSAFIWCIVTLARASEETPHYERLIKAAYELDKPTCSTPLES